MDIKFSGLGMLFADGAGSGSIQSGPTTTITTVKNGRSRPATVGDSRQPSSHQAIRAYNNRRNSPEALADSSPPQFRCVLGREVRTLPRTDNLAEIRPASAAGRRAKTHLQDRRGTKAKDKFPQSMDVATLGLPARQWQGAAQEPTKAPATSGASSHTIPARHEHLQSVQFLKLSKDYEPTGNTRSTRPESFPTRDCPNFQSKNAKPSVQPGSCQGEPASTDPVGVMTAATGRVGFSPPTIHGGANPTLHYLDLAHGKTVDTEQKPAERPRKSQQSAEKPAESRSTSSQRLAEPPPRGNPKCVDSERQAGDASVSTTHRGLYGMQSETCPGQAKTANSSESKDRPAVEIRVAASKPEVLPLPGSEAAAHYASTVINHPPEMGQLSRAAALEGGSHVTTSISQQITVSVEGSLRQGDTHLTIYLNPPELGKVSVRFQQQHEQITILLEVSRPETRREIELTLPQIMRSLQDCGVQIGRLEVSAPRGADELQQQPDAGALGQDHSEMTQHHSSAFGDPQRGVPPAALDHDNGSVHEWLTSTAGDRYPDDLTSQMVYTSGSINVLM